MRDCCMQTLGMMNSKYCRFCGSSLTQSKPELPEELIEHKKVIPTYNLKKVELDIMDITSVINQIIQYLKLKEV